MKKAKRQLQKRAGSGIAPAAILEVSSVAVPVARSGWRDSANVLHYVKNMAQSILDFGRFGFEGEVAAAGHDLTWVAAYIEYQSVP